MNATTQAATDVLSPDTVVLPLRSRRAERAARLAPLRDGVAAVALLWAALPRLRSGVPGELALAAADSVVALALIAAIVHENARRDAHVDHGRVAWVDVAAALMLFVEAYHQRRDGRPGRLLPYATALLALITLSKGLLHERLAGRLARRRVLRLDGDGMYFGWGRLRRVRVPRSEIASLVTGERSIVVTRPDGTRRTISLRDAVEPARVVEAVRVWAEGEGIAVAGER